MSIKNRSPNNPKELRKTDTQRNKIGIIIDQNISYPVSSYKPRKKHAEIPLVMNYQNNIAHEHLRRLFFSLGLDKEHFNQRIWNPFLTFISPGQSVLIKPNMVRHIHSTNGDINSIITHGSIIRCITDYVYLALKGQGKIIIADAPLQSADFNEIKKINHIEEIVEIYHKKGFQIEIKDFRKEISTIDEKHYFLKREKVDGDSLGYTVIDLGDDSFFKEISQHYLRYRVANYDKNIMKKHHNLVTNEYLIPNTVLQADVIINLPKLKTHRIAGISCSLKNLIGLNGDKDRIPHHRIGSIIEGGDEYLRKNIFKHIITLLTEKEDISRNIFGQMLFRALKIPFKYISYINDDHIRTGCWHGNDTLWRSILDINRIVLYADKYGKMRNNPQRKIFTVVDGIISGEGEGPLAPNSKKCGILIAGFNNVVVDSIAATLMGFDYKKIPQIMNSFAQMKYPLMSKYTDSISIVLNDKKCNSADLKKSRLKHVPANNWKGHIELRKNQ